MEQPPTTGPIDPALAPMIAEPVRPGTSMTYLRGRPFRRYLVWFAVASLAGTAVWGSVLGILLPNQVQALEFAHWFTGPDARVDLPGLTDLRAAVHAGTAVPTADQQRLLGLFAHFDADRAQDLSLVTMIGVIATMVCQPLVGVLSDRTRSRLGRRAPWLLAGGVIGAVFLVAVRFAPSVAMLGLLWMVAQVAINAAVGPVNATVADRIPEHRLGTVSAVGGLGTFLGGIVGATVTGLLFARLGLNLYLVLACLVAVGMIGFVLAVRDRPSTDLVRPPREVGAFLRGFAVSLRDRDFRWVWLARVLLGFGYAASTALSLYMMQSYISPALSAAEATKLLPAVALSGFPATVIALLVAGRLSDRLGRRKPFVVAASVLMSCSMAVPLVSPTLPALFIQSVLAGLAFGIYLPVDQALFVDVLPDKDSAGRDLGIAALGNNLGQALGPVLAGQVVALTGGYRMVWALALVLTAFAAVVILPVRRVR